MTITVEIKPEVQAELATQAAARGIDLAKTCTTTMTNDLGMFGG